MDTTKVNIEAERVRCRLTKEEQIKRGLQSTRSNLEPEPIKSDAMNGKSELEKTFVHCTRCRKLALKTDRYCQYCGQPVQGR